mgnify:CR=1 FL=1
MQISLPTDPRLTFEAEFHPAEKREGEWNYSLGVPPKDAWWEITAVAFNNGEETVDVTDFIIDYCEELLPKWEKQLID